MIAVLCICSRQPQARNALPRRDKRLGEEVAAGLENPADEEQNPDWRDLYPALFK
jgi:hypothetical protein